MNQFSLVERHYAADAAVDSTADTATALFAMIEELSRKARMLLSGSTDRPRPAYDMTEAAVFTATKPRCLLRHRERRKELFPPDLFADPAWDILLNLYASHIEQRRETITGIIALAGVPPTTGMRWVHKLVEDEMLILRDDPLDARRKFVQLSPRALTGMDTYFNA